MPLHLDVLTITRLRARHDLTRDPFEII